MLKKIIIILFILSISVVSHADPSDIIGGSSINSTVLGLTSRVAGLALALSTIFLLISVAIIYASNALKKEDDLHQKLIREIARALVIMIAIGLFIPMGWLIYEGIDTCHQIMKPSIDKTIKYKAAAYEINRQSGANADENKSLYEYAKQGVKDNSGLYNSTEKKYFQDIISEYEETLAKKQSSGILDKISNSLQSFGVNLLSNLVWFFGNAIRYIMAIFLKYLLKILFIIGPLALSFSILPPFKNQFEQWLGTFLNVGFAFVTFDIIDHIVIDIMTNSLIIMADQTTGQTGMTIDASECMGFLIATIIMYSCPLWITSKYIGSRDAGAFVEKGMGFAVGVISGMIGTLAGGKGKSGGGGSSGARSVKQSKDAFKED